jgi:hypothetical protein
VGSVLGVRLAARPYASTMTDEAFAEAWEACSLGRAVSHDEHVRIARTLVRQHGTAAAEQRLVEGARRNCEAMESPERFDEDLTRRWSRRIARDVETADAKTFEGFVALHPDLLRSDLLGPPAWKRPQPG